ncbi:hypothetical protein A2U01_0051578 [Trifolium medium]|uniref:Uncharacterized protein n=1 Tax=Trifolium medium TaxID=97028 RepID=A0A392R2A2_9FABA|nr:hypothetical protein [Trifolium medium]
MQQWEKEDTDQWLTETRWSGGKSVACSLLFQECNFLFSAETRLVPVWFGVSNS